MKTSLSGPDSWALDIEELKQQISSAIMGAVPDARLTIEDKRTDSRILVQKDGLPDWVEITLWMVGPNGSSLRTLNGYELEEGWRVCPWVAWRSESYRSILRSRHCLFPSEMLEEIDAWIQPEPVLPERLVIGAIDIAPKVPYSPARIDDTQSFLSSPFESQIKADLDRIDWQSLCDSWPRSLDGKPAQDTKVLIARYGEISRARSCCLMAVSSKAKRDMDRLRLTVSNEFVDNFSHDWSQDLYLWTGQAAPVLTEAQQKCLETVREGRITDACEFAGVRIEQSVIQLACGYPVHRYYQTPVEWASDICAMLGSLAPWRLLEGLERIEKRLIQTSKKPPKRGKWGRRLVNFSGQAQQSKFGLFARLEPDGFVCIYIDSSASNERLPMTCWRSY